MTATEQSRSPHEFKKLILVVFAVVAGCVASYVIQGSAKGVETCNDTRIVKALQTNLMEKVTGVIRGLGSSSEFWDPASGKLLVEMKSIYADWPDGFFVPA